MDLIEKAPDKELDIQLDKELEIFDFFKIPNIYEKIIIFKGDNPDDKNHLTKDIIYELRNNISKVFLFIHDEKYELFYKTFLHNSAINSIYKESYENIFNNIPSQNIIVINQEYIDVDKLNTLNNLNNILILNSNNSHYNKNQEEKYENKYIWFLFCIDSLNEIQAVYKNINIDIDFTKFYEIYNKFIKDKGQCLVIYDKKLYFYKIKNLYRDFYISNYSQHKKHNTHTVTSILDASTCIIDNVIDNSLSTILSFISSVTSSVTSSVSNLFYTK